MPEQTKEVILKSRVDKMFSKKPELQNFSYFFRNATRKEHATLVLYAAHMANLDQKKFMEKYYKGLKPEERTPELKKTMATIKKHYK